MVELQYSHRIIKKQGRWMENSNLLLGSRQERVSLLKAGLTGKDIESLYLRLNGITVMDVNRKDCPA